MPRERISSSASSEAPLPAIDNIASSGLSQAESEGAGARAAGRVAILLAAAVSWLSPRGMMRGARQHPWMSTAVVLSMAIPMVVAWFPVNSGSGPGEASLDKLPMPGKVQFHDGEPAPISSVLRTAARPPQQQFEPGWDVPETRNGVESRFADYRDDVDASVDVNTVGSTRPAPAQPRGAWLTGVIEEFPQPPPSGGGYRESRSRRY